MIENSLPSNLAFNLTEAQKIALFDTLANGSPDILTIHDAYGRIKYSSPSAIEFFGQLPENLSSQPVDTVFKLIHRDDRKGALRELAKLNSGSVSRIGPISFRMRNKRGQWRNLETVVVKVSSSDNSQGFLAITRDETERLEVANELRQSEWRYRRLVEKSPEPIVVVKDDSIPYANPAALKLIGATDLSQISGIPPAEFVHFEDRQRVIEVVSSVNDKYEAVSVTARLVNLEGKEVIVEITAIAAIADGAPAVQLLLHDVTDRERARQALQYQSMHDSLTGLPNRALFTDRVAQALYRAQRFGGKVVILLADLDRFKIVNDSLNHKVGDQILVEVAERIKMCFRPSDTVARFGGDEFVILCEDTEGLINLGILGERLLDALKAPIIVNGGSFHVSVSIGIAESDGESVVRAEELIREADLAMNRAKERGRQRFEIFNKETGQLVARRLQIESELRYAIAHDELRVFYQPVVDSISGSVLGAEALVRWQHPKQGLLLPGAFIEVAEETGLIVQIGSWILREAFLQLRDWVEKYNIPFVLSVNLAASQLLDPTLTDLLKELYFEQEFDRNKAKLCLEVTESALMEERVEVEEKMNIFKELGIGISIDDFGTGYSSFSYLKRFPVQTLKIDRSFVTGLGKNQDDEAIVESMIKLAQSLNIDVVAEGVETGEQLYHLRSLGCRLIQGFYFSKAVPASQFRELLGRPFEVPPLKI